MNKTHDPWATGIALRILYLTILVAGLVIGGYVYLENSELHKVVPPTVYTRVAVLLGQSLALAGVNYILAYRGNNLADVITELCLVVAGIVALVSFQAPHMFMTVIDQEEITILRIGTGRYRDVLAPNSLFYYGIIVSILLLVIVIYRVRRLAITDKTDA